MRDILNELGVNFKSHELPGGLEYAVTNYIHMKELFRDALQQARAAFIVKEEAVAVKTFVNDNVTPDGIYGTVTDQFAFWQEIKDFINQHENENWRFSNFVKDVVDINTDPYDHYEDLRETVTVYAWIKSDDQPNTEDQEQAINMVKMTELDLISAKKRLEWEIKNATIS